VGEHGQVVPDAATRSVADYAEDQIKRDMIQSCRG